MSAITSTYWDGYANQWNESDQVRIYADSVFRSWRSVVAPLITDLPNSRVLDFGCGTGQLTEEVAPYCGEIVAIDTSKAMIGHLQIRIGRSRMRNVAALQATVNGTTSQECQILAQGFDLILASSVCPYLESYEEMLVGLVRILNPGGLYAQWDWSEDMPMDRMRTAFESSQLAIHTLSEAFSFPRGQKRARVILGVGRLPRRRE